MPMLEPIALVGNRVAALRGYHSEAGVPRAQLDVSGGVDSAVMLGLLAEALGPEQITAVYSGIHSSPESLTRARRVAQIFGVPLISVDLTGLFEELVDAMVRESAVAGHDHEAILQRLHQGDPTLLGSMRSTLRAPVGRGFNRMLGGGIRHGTGNECEDRWLRFYQKGGDGEVDTNPLAMLAKGEVYQLACELGVPEDVIAATPSPDLWGAGVAHNDEDELLNLTGVPFTYSQVDPATGDYRAYGSIERTSRFLDWAAGQGLPDIFDEGLGHEGFQEVLAAAPRFQGFQELKVPVELLMVAVRTTERATRHKANPMIPALGTRRELIEEGILGDALPALGRAAAQVA